MPGSPPASPRFGLPRYSPSDPATLALIFNAIGDGVDPKGIRFDEGVLASRPSAGIVGRFYRATDVAKLYYDDGSAWQYVTALGGGRGKSIIATTETYNTTSLGVLPTPDRVTGVVHPANGVLSIWYDALWKLTAGQPSSHQGLASIYIGSNELQIRNRTGTGGSLVYATLSTPGVTNGKWTGLGSGKTGLVSPSDLTPSGGLANDAVNVSTGQIVGATLAGVTMGGGRIDVWVNAGTYNVEVRFARTGTQPLTVKERKLWVQSQAR